MKNIVVAIEFDEELEDVIDFTTNLLEDKNTDVHVVHAYQAHAELVDYAPHLINAIDDYEEHLQKQAESVRKIVAKLHAKDVHAHGYMKPIERSIVNSILQFVDEKNAELIVVGTHHPGRIERLFLGSTTENLVRESNVPVVVVPRGDA